MWLDADVVVMSSLDQLAHELEDGRFSVVVKNDGGPANFLFGARANNPVVGAWAQAQDLLIGCANDLGSLPWTALGNSILEWLLPSADFKALPAARYAPIGWSEWRRFFSETPAEHLLTDRPVTVMLFNKMMGSSLKDTTEEELLSSQTLLAQLLRRALGRRETHDERRGRYI